MAKEKENRKNDRKEQSMAREILGDVLMIVIVIASVFLLEKYVLLNAKIPSESMQNTIMVGNRIFGSRLAYRKEDPRRYDIVIFRYPDDESQLFIKRVIGLPGDEIDIHDGGVYVNGSDTPLTDSFCPEQGVTDEGDLDYPFIVPEGCYFMLGDNREHSKDSRYWIEPFVEKDEILAKAVVRYWPLNKIGKLQHGLDSYYEPPAAE